MSSLAPLLETWFSERLIKQRHSSPNTIAAYRDAFRLLLGFAQQQIGKPPSKLALQDLDARLIGDFLEDLEKQRSNGARTRNARLAAVHSFFHYAALREPAHSALIQRVLAIPQKRFSRPVVTFLIATEITALLAAPELDGWIGRRDHALLLTMIQTGLRVSELTDISCSDLQLGTGAHVRCTGKGRKERCIPLTSKTVTVLRAWLQQRAFQPSDPLFPNRSGGMLSRDAVERLLHKYVRRSRQSCPSLRDKRVTPHVLRHTSAMRLLQAGIDRAVIALWLGHESIETTQIYLHADLSMKERALARTAPLHTVARRYRAPDSLLAFLEGL